MQGLRRIAIPHRDLQAIAAPHVCHRRSGFDIAERTADARYHASACVDFDVTQGTLWNQTRKLVTGEIGDEVAEAVHGKHVNFEACWLKELRRGRREFDQAADGGAKLGEGNACRQMCRSRREHTWMVPGGK